MAPEKHSASDTHIGHNWVRTLQFLARRTHYRLLVLFIGFWRDLYIRCPRDSRKGHQEQACNPDHMMDHELCSDFVQ